ncbi:MAG: hypothetical protein HC833_10840 [Leptolyngbyaceae cyanobacterium RM1_406_9]|nr:hypothetical protein [Leptolyngbyaceae cyanobacterium RM1_406_9]
MKSRTMTVTFHHTESGWKEEKTVTCLFTDANTAYVITKVFVVELNTSLVFDKETNEFLVPD